MTADNPHQIKYRFSSSLLVTPDSPQATADSNPEQSPSNSQKGISSQLDASIMYYQQYIQDNPHLDHPFDGLGCPEDEVGYFEGRVEEWYRENREQGRILGNPYDALSVCYSMKSSLLEGEKWYLEMIKTEPGVFQLYFGLGNIYYKMRSFQLAEEFYRKALELNCRIEKAYLNISFIYCYHRYDNGQAEEWANFTLKINKDNEYAKLILELVSDNLSRRIPSLSRLARLFPSYTRIRNALGMAHIEGNQPSKAIAEFEKGLEGNPNYLSL